MTPGLPTSTPAAKVQPTSAWLLLSIVLTTMLAVGRWTKQPASGLASRLAPARAVPTTRRIAGVRPALPHPGSHAALASAAL